MNEVILLKQGEIVLKGQNRRSFEQRLLDEIKKRAAYFGSFEITSAQSTVYVEPRDDDADIDGAFESMRKVFGIVSVSRAAACEKDADAIAETAKSYVGEALGRAESFKVESKRADKRFPMTSIELSQHVGGLLFKAFPDTKPEMKNPEITVNIEVRERHAYVSAGAVHGAGGLPIGSNGRAVTLLSGGIDSPVSSYMIAKRGVSVIPVHFFSPPYTSQMAREKVISLTKILASWCMRLTLEIVPFTNIQEMIARECREEYMTVITRRFMMRIAEEIARQNGCGAIVTGENLGQVASQTMDALSVIEEPVSLPVLRPLIGMDKEEIVTFARKIGTFETSILPYEDCCTVFTPSRPKTRPKLSDVLTEEAKLPVAELVGEALQNIERIRLEEYTR